MRLLIEAAVIFFGTLMAAALFALGDFVSTEPAATQSGQATAPVLIAESATLTRPGR
jgi:hypothetical protein